MTHTCTNCGKEIYYDNKVSWLNVRTKLNKKGYHYCRTCAGTIGRLNSFKTPTGRPRGSKTAPDKRISHGKEGAGKKLNQILTFEMRMKGIAKRNGFSTYEEYLGSLSDWKRYKIDVQRITKQQPLHLLENFDKRGVNGKPGTYTLDHIISLRKGFNENIPPEIVGHISNLQMLPWEENIKKGWK